MEELFQEYKDKFYKLKGENKFSRLGRHFKTKENNYFYDTGTGKVFQISDSLYQMLEKWIDTDKFEGIFELSLTDVEIEEALKEIFTGIEKENILKAPVMQEMVGPQVYNLEEELKKERNQITLELTERCNMRCKYCIYHCGNGGFREFGKRDMSFDIAQKALDEFMKGCKKDEAYISFYGGEPLIKYDLIKQCMEYCLEKYSEKRVVCTMTTNATLVTKEIAEYFAGLPNAIITVSLDGPEEMHDKYRVYQNGKGTFKDTVRGLKLLVEAFGERAGNCIMINSVVPEFEIEKLEKIQNFFDSLEWLPKDTNFTSSYVDKGKKEAIYGGVDSKHEREIRKISLEEDFAFDPIGKWAGQKFVEDFVNKDETSQFGIDEVVKDLGMIHNRILVDEPMDIYFFNGCCTPGARRIYVTVEGKYLVCEKMGPSPYIGDVYNGIDTAAIKKEYVDKFRNEAKKYCKNCWAVHLCSLCYVDCFDENGVHFNYRHRKCEINRIAVERTLKLYHEILEHKPELLEKLNEYDFS